MILDLFNDFRDGSRLLDLLEVMSGQRLVSPLSPQSFTGSGPMNRLTDCLLVFSESGEGPGDVSAQEQHRKGAFLSEEEIGEELEPLRVLSDCTGSPNVVSVCLQIKLVNINIPDITDGKPSIILGLIWTIILQYHVGSEFLCSCVFSSLSVNFFFFLIL